MNIMGTKYDKCIIGSEQRLQKGVNIDSSRLIYPTSDNVKITVKERPSRCAFSAIRLSRFNLGIQKQTNLEKIVQKKAVCESCTSVLEHDPVYRSEIVKDAINLFKNLGVNDSEETKAIDFCLNMLKSNKGFMIGDCTHYYNNAYVFLIKNLDVLYKAGIRHIYCEYFKPATLHEELLTRYFNGENNLDEIAKSIDNTYCPEKAICLLYKARKLRGSDIRDGIRVFGIDKTEGSIVDRSEYWANNVREYTKQLKDGKKYIIIGGSAHMDDRSNLGVNGILKIPGITTDIDPYNYYNKYTQINETYGKLDLKNTEKKYRRENYYS